MNEKLDGLMLSHEHRGKENIHNRIEEEDKLIFLDDDDHSNRQVLSPSSSPSHSKDETLITIDSGEEIELPDPEDVDWKILIVDDEPGIHDVTKLAIKNLKFDGKGIQFISAYSGKEARELVEANPDTALIFLDVVMETTHEGLDVAKYIREELNNKLVRIILRTGQSGEAPEQSVIVNYDINDYKEKTELTRKKLCTSTIVSLRSYRDIVELDRGRRTLSAANRKIQQSFQDLKKSQLQLIQHEKMAVLGELITGIAHEINNPVTAISNNIVHARGYFQNLIDLLNHYQDKHPELSDELEDELEDYSFMKEDLPKLIASMVAGANSIRSISKSMRVFSRSDSSKKVDFDIREGIDSTLLILNHRFKSTDRRPAIQLEKKYGELPDIQGYPGQISQVFMNLIANALDAFEEANEGRSLEDMKAQPNQIQISASVNHHNPQIVIQISDNGPGMSSEIQEKVFDHLFTTKPVGKGTGLGLSISRRIIEEEHGGQISCQSTLGQGTKFTIALPF